MNAGRTTGLLYTAISDQSRRRMLSILAQGDISVSEMVKEFNVSQPAISQHLAVLREAGLVRPRREGRQKIYSLRPEPLREIFDWISFFEKLWDEKLLALQGYLGEQKPTAVAKGRGNRRKKG